MTINRECESFWYFNAGAARFYPPELPKYQYSPIPVFTSPSSALVARPNPFFPAGTIAGVIFGKSYSVSVSFHIGRACNSSRIYLLALAIRVRRGPLWGMNVGFCENFNFGTSAEASPVFLFNFGALRRPNGTIWQIVCAQTRLPCKK